MIILKSIKLLREFTPFEEGEYFEFKHVNLLVGDQGCGKSSLLYLLMESQNKTGIAKSLPVKNGVVSSYITPEIEYVENQEFKDIIKVDSIPFDGDYIYHDAEKHNPRNMEMDYDRRDFMSIHRFITWMDDTGGLSFDERENILGRFADYRTTAKDHVGNSALFSRFKSHGQVLLPMLEKLGDMTKGLLFLDEPETALSVRSQYKLLGIIEKLALSGIQLFIATHSPILIEGMGEVLSLEHKKWMTSTDFLSTQK